VLKHWIAVKKLSWNRWIARKIVEAVNTCARWETRTLTASASEDFDWILTQKLVQVLRIPISVSYLLSFIVSYLSYLFISWYFWICFEYRLEKYLTALARRNFVSIQIHKNARLGLLLLLWIIYTFQSC